MNAPKRTKTYYDKEKTKLKTYKIERENGDFYKFTYDSEGNEDSYSKLESYYEVKGEQATKEEYEAFIKSKNE